MSNNKTFYQLTYFDTKENRRKKYLNGTSWTNIEAAEVEYGRIMKQKAMANYFPNLDRTKWALEAIRNKKRVVVKNLSDDW